MMNCIVEFGCSKKLFFLKHQNHRQGRTDFFCFVLEWGKNDNYKFPPYFDIHFDKCGFFIVFENQINSMESMIIIHI